MGNCILIVVNTSQVSPVVHCDTNVAARAGGRAGGTAGRAARRGRAERARGSFVYIAPFVCLRRARGAGAGGA